jgi:2-phospho-L-lactate transferase/gluconeogenesis factor (CofD/UPF0052 family)
LSYEGRSSVRVVLFSGGRGSGALTTQLVSNPGVQLTIVINGYDDGASTGEVRRFLGDSLGPSDFRKNASRVAAELRTAPPEIIALLDRRLPQDVLPEDVERILGDAAAFGGLAIAERLARFREEARASQRAFDYRDCALGNLVFAGGFLLRGRTFNAAVDDYAALLNLPAGLIENVTDGTNAWLVAVGADGRYLPTEEAIVAVEGSTAIDEIFIIRRALTEEETRACADRVQRESILRSVSVAPALNPRLREAIASADLIVYAPGTQHSSLFPSYLTEGVGELIAGNLRGIKLLVTNIEPDVEITGRTAVDLVDRALYYLRRRNTLTLPTPALITHYLLNDPGHREPERPYVPLGQLDTIEDPRLVRIGNYEEGVTGRHDATRVLMPFIESVLRRGARRRVAVLLHDAGSQNKVAQTLLEIVRGGVESVGVDLLVCHPGAPLDVAFARSLPFTVRTLPDGVAEFQRMLVQDSFDYALLFESSGMYRGEDIVGILTHLVPGRLDAVWGSRRLSMRDIEASYAMRYQRSGVLRSVSYLGSHVLSLAYLALFGRYIADTLSGVRAVRAADVASEIDLTSRDANHQILGRLLRRKADVLEVPVQFLPLSPERVKRTTVGDGLRALATVVRSRVAGA